MTPERWRQVTAVFHAARLRDAPARAQYLDQACASDRALRDEVDAMLAAHDEGGGFPGPPVSGLIDDGGRLETGAMVGPYRIDRLIGAGGMGEVYRARDTNLGRDVAIKVLPDAFTSDPERLRRFEHEARVLAALNHPHIASIHGLEEEADPSPGSRQPAVRALVLELVEGETLADRIARGPVPLADALPIARQIAEALEAAHEKGIIHRDLKPANIKITPAGVVKVLDFGLAKAVADVTGADVSRSPTVTVGGTRDGVILGTPAYMSPEQARGQAVDKRTDIWAFGCVVYEMLSGQAAFGGATVSDVIVSVLERDPAWNALPATVPPGVHRLLRHCLEKDPVRRLRDAGDVRIEIEDLAVRAGEPAAKPIAPSRSMMPWVVLIGTVMAAVIGSWSWINYSRRPAFEPTGPSARFTIQFPSDAPMIGQIGVGSQLALSPDGSQLAYIARAVQGSNRLYVRKVDQLESRRVPGADGAVDPFFSPDGQWIGFFVGQKLMKVALAGGLPQTIWELDPLAEPAGASWSPDDSVVFAKPGAGLWRVPSTGGTPTAVTTLTSNEANHLWPDVLPGGKAVLFTAVPVSGEPQIYVQSLETGQRRALGPGVAAHYLSSGHVVYGLGGSLFAVPFDAERLDLAGKAVKVVDNVLSKGDAAVGVPQAAFSRVGSLAFVSTTPLPLTLLWADRRGEERPLNVPTRSYFQPRLAPDEQRLAVMIAGDVWLWDFSRENLSRLTDDGGHNYLLWTPDGHRVSFLSNSGAVASGARGTIAWKPVEDSNADAESLLSGQTSGAPLSWSPDGRVLAFVNLHPVTRQDIWTLRVNEKSQPRPFLQTRFAEGGPAFSPDGRWLAYVSDESGRSEVYVQPFPGPGAKFVISTGGGSEPVWPRRGHELFYRNGDEMMAVDVTTGLTFAAGKPRRLFDGRYARSTSLWPNYDVSADGQRFLMVKGVEEFTSPTQINVVLSWSEELKRLVPIK